MEQVIVSSANLISLYEFVVVQGFGITALCHPTHTSDYTEFSLVVMTEKTKDTPVILETARFQI